MKSFFKDFARCMCIIFKYLYKFFSKALKIGTIFVTLLAWNIVLPAYILACMHVDSSLPGMLLYILPMNLVTLSVTVSCLYAYYGYRRRKYNTACERCAKQCNCR